MLPEIHKKKRLHSCILTVIVPEFYSAESQDTAMAEQAAKLQEKFAKEQLEYRSGEKKVS